MKHLAKVSVIALFLCLLGCASTISESGKDFSYQKDYPIKIGKTTKAEIIDKYGTPSNTEIKGNYQILTYSYSRESLKHGRAVGMGLLSAIPGVGLATLAMDQGVKKDDMAREFKILQFFTDFKTGVVKDYYYHDSDNVGQDESETLYLKAMSLKSDGGKNKECNALLEKAISLNSKNHRALNDLAWELIDSSVDVDKGISLAQRAVEVFPDSPYNTGTLGVGYFKKGDLENAEKYLDQAVKLYPIYEPGNLKSLQHDQEMLRLVREGKNKQY
jgi:tetratricopeptide (TPR) repeat protein